MAALVNTNVLVYRHDPRDRRTQRAAAEILRRGIADGSLRVAYQAVIEFACSGNAPPARNRPAAREWAALRAVRVTNPFA